MGKYTYNEVYDLFKKNDCTMLTEQYSSLKQDIDFVGSCGHYCRNNLSKILTKRCFKCCLCDKNSFRGNIIQGKSYLKLKQKMERIYNMTHKYRSDFTPENYNKTLTCWKCNETKSIRLFPYRKQYKDNKEKRCKKCNKENNKSRRYAMNKQQYVKSILNSSKRTANKRKSKGRENCGNHTITIDDIFELYDKQNGKCALSGRTLEFKVVDENSLSIDRIDSTKGYTIDNIQLTTFIANQAKNNLSNKDFFYLCKDIYHNFKQ
jgi:hypothetical protein